jgi:hypothetical protein
LLLLTIEAVGNVGLMVGAVCGGQHKHRVKSGIASNALVIFFNLKVPDEQVTEVKLGRYGTIDLLFRF